MDLLARLKQARTSAPDIDADTPPDTSGACARCGERFERLVDPAGRWFVCTRCGHLNGTREET